jgi:integrase
LPAVTDVDEVRRLIDALRSSRDHALFLLYLGTAIRKSEGLGLMWSQVDLDNATITITRA